MGADISVRRPKNLDLGRLYEECKEVPIDVEVKYGWINFHYGYWGEDHELKCEQFVKKFIKKHNVKSGKWNY